jgi:hypothetical protein
MDAGVVGDGARRLRIAVLSVLVQEPFRALAKAIGIFVATVTVLDNGFRGDQLLG